MRPLVIAIALLTCASLAHAQATENFKLIKLEQDVRNLERQVQQLARQVDVLSRQLGRSTTGGARPEVGPRARSVEATGSSGAWLDAANWRRVQPGMSELEVIGALGPPTSMRHEDGTRVLLYALEIGSSGFLSGSVSLRERTVVSVETPVLK